MPMSGIPLVGDGYSVSQGVSGDLTAWEDLDMVSGQLKAGLDVVDARAKDGIAKAVASMQKSAYDPSGSVAAAGGIPAYVSTASDGFTEYTHTKTGTVNALVNANGNGNIKFKATAAYTDGDTFTVNGTAITTLNGTPAFSTGETVSAFLDGTALNFKPGGSSANYDVVGGTAQPAGKDNRFWVNTSVVIPHYGISSAVPTDALPCPWGAWADGDVVAVSGGTANPFVAYRGNKGAISTPYAVLQRQSGVWNILQGSRFYTGSAWVTLPMPPLFDNGAEYVAWEAAQFPSHVGAEVVQKTGSLLRLSVSAVSYGNVGFVTSSTLDVTGATKLNVNISSLAYGQFAYMGLFSSKTLASGNNGLPANTVLTMNNLIVGANTLDISGVTGSHYVGICIFSNNAQPNAMDVTKIWTE